MLVEDPHPPTPDRAPGAPPGRPSDDVAGPPAEDVSPPVLTLADREALLELMVGMRTFEERGVALYKQGRTPGSFYDGHGQEAIPVGATFAMGPDDVLCSPLIRDMGAHLVRGTDLTEIIRHHLGRDNALSRGREGNVHFGDPRRGVVPMVSMLPDMFVVAVGMAMAFRLRGERRVALTFFGDGATSPGAWHEAMNFAGLRREPVVIVCENNGLAYSTPSSAQFVVSPADRAPAYGMPGVVVDGNDVEAVFAAVHAARERALAGDGPTLVEARTMRMHGHGSHDDARYVDPALLEVWRQRDPIATYEATLREAGIDVDAVRTRVLERLDLAVEAALASPLPDPARATDGLFATEEPVPLGRGDAPWSGFAAEASIGGSGR
ncbi:thiamine pyrophosphate-dependent dehydrogenase E1 component subunit alpha [Patulibacter sp.]|uniref:thiamine pyrophosphate-dependent dehydrogenase E1 component subunit alpha n=1 Tax=Patulibacter sp. TaxID=1912859 RepID=UPI002729375A|nr:thiamine pyrophosphate-dependent dehydrogenase E1 component subunit alpha [Patulibacter sp.]MDO9407770.1 thiamine pyrophosphate-dependent dehydrogenase E1 component subunit alpha [Patulibacter sp.]